ncbi:TonB-dependent siderophore receptor [Flavobacterium sp. RNTU_13]|uniref:TonB-dependent siderophore receptor n=1 Tax=Flavobacterium sp. RNTU_13 TaxID=3375145 RepID=UPI0039887EFE
MKTSIFRSALTLITLLLGITLYAQDKGSVNGTVVLNDNTPAENITVVLKGTVYSAVTNTKGTYEIKNVKPGTYTLRAASVGIKTVEQSITVNAGQVTTANVSLNESAEQLNEVIINGGINKFTRSTSTVVSKMPLKDIENPQVYNTITAELLKEQVITQVDDAYKNVPGLDRLWESTGRGGDGAGYFSLRGFPVQPTMVNGLPALSNGSADPQNIERIEVIKGPSGTLFGSSLISYGGLINITTKKPFDTFKGNINYIGGTYDLNRFTADINTPFANAEKGAVRINAAYHSEGSFQDAGFKKSFFVAPSIVYNVNDKLSFFVNTEIFNGRSTNTAMLFLDRFSPLHVNNIDQLKAFGYSNKRSYTSNDLYIDTPTFNVQGQMNYKINDQWTSQTVLSRSSAKSDGFYSYIYEGTTTAEALLPDRNLEGLLFARYMSKQNSSTYATDIQQNFIGDFKLGSLRNRMVVGLDYFNRNVQNNSTDYPLNGYIYIGKNQSKFDAVAAAMGQPTGTDDTGVLTQAGMNAILANSSVTPSSTKEEIYSAYASDVLNITPALSVMLSLRADRFINKSTNFNQTAYSPKFGIVYQPILDKVSVFANYMDGFSNVAPTQDQVLGASIARSFDPEHAKQLEGGTKLNLLGDKLSATLSYYYIEVNDMVYSKQIANDPDPVTGAPVMPNIINFQDGKQRSQGFEAFLTANPVSGLNVIAGYSYNDSKLVAGDEDFIGKRPESAGAQNMVNLWASYRFSNTVLNGALEGFGLGFGGNYASENKIFNRNKAGTFTLPEYTILNASAFYNISDVTLTLKLDNLTNKDYYKGWSTISAQKPRVISASLSYSF